MDYDEEKESNENLAGFLKYMEILLDSVGHKKVEVRSIFHVPEKLRESRAEAYLPQVVSIGPVHWGTKANLLDMEEIKWRCMKHLFQRTEFEEATCLRRCSRAIWMLDEIVRASYVDVIKFNRNDLAKISTLDGCFLLELLITGSPELNNKDLATCPGAEVIQWEEVLSDLTLLENQIPIIVLDLLSQILFRKRFKRVNYSKLIQKSALSILGYDYTYPVSSDSDPSKFKAVHLVELVHSFIDKEIDVDKDSTIINTGIEQVGDRKLKARRCATRLEAAGVKITVPEKKNISKNVGEETDALLNKDPENFDLKIKFIEGKLEIPPLRITATTEAKWRNLIAWELNRTRLEKHRRSKEARTRCLFISYAWFIQSLICCVDDVKLLRDEKVILVDSDKGQKDIMSDEDLLDLFRSLTVGVSDAQIEMDPWFVQEIMKMNSWARTVDLATEAGIVLWHSCRGYLLLIWWYMWYMGYMCKYSIRGFVAAYLPTKWRLIAVGGATAGLVLTAIQTVYAIIDNK